MLTITPRASTVIRRVTAHPQLAPSSGLRIGSPADPRASLEVTIAHRPQPGDRVVEQEGGRLFVAPAAVERVDGRELDAVTDEEGRVQFVSRNAA
jgi:Fe-S cluster assembly iron-binding protein IscA